ncbi:hypothetical protein C8K36_10496 [Rhodococcus sp. OK519]|nr:hypothetical protein C8K36_10496 [Rhodococcus sp. OK519]
MIYRGSTTNHCTVLPTFQSAPGLPRAARYVARACAPAISPLVPDGGLGKRNSEGFGPGHTGTSSGEMSVSMKAGRCTATRSGMGLVSAASVMPVPPGTSLFPLLQPTTARARPATTKPTTARRTRTVTPLLATAPIRAHHPMWRVSTNPESRRPTVTPGNLCKDDPSVPGSAEFAHDPGRQRRHADSPLGSRTCIESGSASASLALSVRSNTRWELSIWT